MVCRTRIASFVLNLLICASVVQAVYVSWVIRCCKKGQHKAAKAAGNPTSCNSDDLDRRRFRNELDRTICRHAERICCVKEIQKLSCEGGKYEASQGQSCDSFRPFVGGDDFRECCDCCALGIRAKQDKDVHCSLPVFRSLVTQNTSLPCLKVFKECCSGSVTKPPITIPTRIPKCSDNFCQQECRDISGQGPKCFCRKGYQLQADQVSCRDINECQLRNGSVCNPFQACVNSPGSFRCVNQTEAACRLGEEKLRGRCIDIDECVRGLHRCGQQQQCVNNDGSYTCTCNTGYQASGSVCYDKDECRTQESQCPSNATCINTQGSYRCECGRGTTLKNNKCEDLDECSIGQYSCPRGSRCENTDGSYKCLIKCSRGQKLSDDGQCRPLIVDICSSIQCGAGFSCNASSPARPCRDIDECSESPPKCKSGEGCLNFIGTYECRDPCKYVDCGSGLKCEPAGRLYSCIDIDECRLTPRNCTGDNEICVNKYGGFNCRCRDRFRRNPETKKCERINLCTGVNCPRGYQCVIVDDSNFQCKDINECKLLPLKCRGDQRCVNYPGGYYCTCRDGYRLNRLINRCQDIDECFERRSGCNQICENTAGSFVCKCRSGFKMLENQRTCIDVNECSDGTSGCAQVCRNTPGSYVCGCRRAYTLNPNGRTCDDRDECQTAPCQYRCFNTEGSYYCSCPRGYNKTSVHFCSDFDECETGVKCNASRFCFNTYGGHRCIPRLQCPSDYVQMSATRCDRSCGAGDISCYNKKITRYSLWTFRLRSNEIPQRIFNYRVVAYRYKTAPEIRYYFKRGNTENFFEIITQRKSDGIYASIRNKRKIKGPKIMSLEFYGDVIHSETGDLASRFVNRIYVFVSRNEF